MNNSPKPEQEAPSAPISESFPIPKPDPSFKADLIARMRAGEWNDGMDELWEESQQRRVERLSKLEEDEANGQ